MKNIFSFSLRTTIPFLLLLFAVWSAVFTLKNHTNIALEQAETQSEAEAAAIMDQMQWTMNYLLQQNDTNGMARHFEVLRLAPEESSPANTTNSAPTARKSKEIRIKNLRLAVLVGLSNQVVMAANPRDVGKPVEKVLSTVDADRLRLAQEALVDSVAITDDRGAIEAYYPVFYPPDPATRRSVSFGVLVLKFNLLERRVKVHEAVKSEVLYQTGINLVLIFLLALIIDYRLARRVSHLVECTRHFTRGDFNVRANAAGKDEVSTLAEAFNHMAEQVELRTSELKSANAELAKVAKLKDEFLASMSHELRTPLNNILGMSEALQEQAYGAVNEKQMRSLRTIEESGRHLLELINDILDLSKIEAGKLELQIENVLVQSLCEASLRLVKQTAFKKKIEVSSRIDPRLVTVRADERRLKQIIMNLLSNAVKFTPEGGQVGLEVAPAPEEEGVRFTVWDTGIGISKEDAKRLFQAFVQLDTRLSRQYGGTGLGLALVSRMTKLHGGTVSVESEVGKGSRFTVLLPMSMEDLPARPVAAASEEVKISIVPRTAGPALILLVEDNRITRESMSDYLIAKGYRVITAEDGQAAVEQSRTQMPDLILMDVQMAGMDGLEATRQIKARSGTRVIPVIALTALAMTGDRERCFAAGVDDYLSKPVALKDLIATIEQHLQKTVALKMKPMPNIASVSVGHLDR